MVGVNGQLVTIPHQKHRGPAILSASSHWDGDKRRFWEEEKTWAPHPELKQGWKI